MEAAALDDEQRRLVRELQMNSAMVVPLAARDRTLGAMTFVWAESGASTRRASSSSPRSSAAAPGSRSTTRGCSRASTPPPRRCSARCCRPSCPSCPGFELVVRYLPSDARDHAGGDWYDAFQLPDGRFGIVIGDVGGRGMDAAATMGQIRNSLRAYALKGARPGRGDRRPAPARRASAGAIAFVTVVYVVLDGDRRVRAGHRRPPAAAARRRRAARTTSRRRAARRSGSATPTPCTLGRFELAPGETLWLYTDGLVESRRRSIDVGLAALADAAGRAEGELEEIADHLLATLPGARDDDIALLGLRRA